jgi:transcriptional regulator with XRE-family HTH domain
MEPTHPLRDWRKAKQLTQTQVGEKVGITASQISQIETRRRGASLDVAARIERLTEGAVTVQSFVKLEAAE